MLMKHYASKNISKTSRISLHYFLKIVATIAETVVFVLLGIQTISGLSTGKLSLPRLPCLDWFCASSSLYPRSGSLVEHDVRGRAADTAGPVHHSGWNTGFVFSAYAFTLFYRLMGVLIFAVLLNNFRQTKISFTVRQRQRIFAQHAKLLLLYTMLLLIHMP